MSGEQSVSLVILQISSISLEGEEQGREPPEWERENAGFKKGP
jgi:hypothetical protein